MAKDHASKSSSPRLKILIIEDNNLIRKALAGLLADRGTVVAVGTLKEGLNELDNNPNCVIVDLMLPDGNGIAIIREVIKRAMAARTIITTGVHKDDIKFPGLHVDCILQKPYNIGLLLAELDKSQV